MVTQDWILTYKKKNNDKQVGNGPGVFDPRQFPREEHCSNCFSGSMYRLECTGKLLQSDSYTGDICSQFNGKCCQGKKKSNQKLIIRWQNPI